VSARVDGVEVELRPGDTLLVALRRAGRDVPTLCGAAGAPEGGCRLCLVEVAGCAAPRAACHTPAEDGMAVTTSSPRLEALRREILDLWLSTLPEGALRPDPRGTTLARLLARYGLARSSFGHAPAAAGDRSHPYLRFDPARCIVCRRCLHACDDVQGSFVYTVEGRGAETRLAFGLSNRFLDSGCTACGACVDVCPSGALADRDREEEAAGASRRVRSTCGYCGVGCGVEVESDGRRVLCIDGAADSPVNRGHLCAKGRYAHGYQRAPDRLRRPLLRDGAGFRELSWPQAVGWLAGRLRELRDRHGPDALGVLTSSRSTNEAAYLLQKLFRAVLGTNNVDCCARVCHSSTAQALRRVTGTGAASASYADIELARALVVAGANPTEAHPVLGARLKQAARRGVPLLVVDPRRIELAEFSVQHLALRPGTNVALLNALAKVVVEEGLVDRAYLAERTEGFEPLRAHLAGLSLEASARTSGVEPEALRRAGRWLGEAGPVLFVHGLGLSELTQGTESVVALANLALLTGSVGRPGAGLLPLRGQNNVQGNADMGSLPTHLTGYQRLDDAGARERVGRLWGAPPPRRPGLTLPEMLAAALAGRLRGLWIQGEDVAQSEPQEGEVLRALARLELLVVQELFLSETARRAHLVLPAASALEQEGTFTNAERRIQAVRPALAPPGEARPDWEVVRDVARALGADWSYVRAADVLDEIARVAPDLFGGVSFERLGGDGLQWPCPARDHPGTPTLHVGAFVRGRGRLEVVEHRPSPEHDVEGMPYLLVTGRVLQHYNVGSMTRRTPSQELVPEDRLEIHPRDAAREGLADGDLVGVESRWGITRVRVRVTERVAPGALFLSFHHPRTHTNRLIGPHRDPDSHCPEYKVTAVRLRPAAWDLRAPPGTGTR
jgi:formate dehydrogenase alpha subunit